MKYYKHSKANLDKLYNIICKLREQAIGDVRKSIQS